MKSALLHVQDLTLAFDGQPPVLEGLSFTLAPGEAIGLVGPSGSGKSLAATALLGFLPAGARVLSGSAKYTGKSGETVDLLGLRESRLARLRGREIGLVFQEVQLSLNPILRCGVQLRESVRYLRPEVKDDSAFIREALGRVELGDATERILASRPAQLSGGQLQRVLIAMALIGQPRLLIADEPTTALDSITQADIVRLLDRLRRELQMGMLFISHDADLLERVTDRRIYLGTSPPTCAPPAAVVPPAHPTAAAPLALEVRNLSLGYGTAEDRVVNEVSFRLRAGEWLALVGPSGCGKSTIASWLVGLLPGTVSSLHAAGRYVPAGLSGRDWRDAIGAQLIFQDVAGSLNPELTIGEAIGEVARLYPDGETGHELLASLGLDPDTYAQRYPDELSGGQRQRVVIARALAARPRILICDEAMSALDGTLREGVQTLLENVCRARGIAVLFITHDLRHVARHADELLIMDRGSIVERGAAAAILRAPASGMGRKLVRAARLGPG